MPGFFASNALMASSTKVRLGISAAQWLQNVSSLTCCAAAGAARLTATTKAAPMADGMFVRMDFLPWLALSSPFFFSGRDPLGLHGFPVRLGSGCCPVNDIIDNLAVNPDASR